MGATGCCFELKIFIVDREIFSLKCAICPLGAEFGAPQNSRQSYQLYKSKEVNPNASNQTNSGENL